MTDLCVYVQILIYQKRFIYVKTQSNPCTDPAGSRKLTLPGLQTISTRMW